MSALMSAQTATRYTCRDCRKTYRSFRSEAEWLESHRANVCTAHGGPRPASPPPEGPLPNSPVSPPPLGPTPAGPMRPQPAPPVVAQDGVWWQTGPVALGVTALAALLLLYVAFDGYRIMADATDAGPRALQLLIAAVIALPCLFGAFQLTRSALRPGSHS